MMEKECLDRMIAPGTRRPGKYREGVIQIWVTRSCDKSCFSCTQASNLGGKPEFISLEHFDQAVLSLKDYFGVVGVFGGNPCLHPKFPELCEILRNTIPYERRGLWSNNLLKPENGAAARATFNPAVSNLNVHLDQVAYKNFKDWWPECGPVGLEKDSRHSPCYVAMKDVIPSESERWELISNCDINRHWSAMIGVFRGKLRAWFCEIAGAQAMLHQDEPEYPDTGVDPTILHQKTHTGAGLQWWECGMHYFAEQVRKHCHSCSVPLRGYGQLAVSDPNATEQVSETHRKVFEEKKVKGRHPLQIVTHRDELKEQQLDVMTKYLQNSSK